VTTILSKETFVPKYPTDLLWLGPHADVLKVPAFARGFDMKAIETYIKTANSVPYLVIDLRDNLGGSDEAVDRLLGFFAPAGARAGAFISKSLISSFSKATGKSWRDRAAVAAWAPSEYTVSAQKAKTRYKGHFAVLINGQTASAGEVAACALRDCAGAKIFGTPSMGKVLFMTAVPLPGGYFFYYPIYDYWTVKGERLEGHPVVPDFPEPADTDKVYDPYPLRAKALKWLEETYPIASSNSR
jgi:C-terminal processing protease CtpA/Prc